VRRNLGSITKCATHESTKVLSVRKLMAITGSQKIYLVTENTRTSISLNVSVETVVTELNALNGELTKNATVCGEDSLLVSVKQ
jgi:hypothetical protein